MALADVAARFRKLDHATSLLVYICTASAASQPAVPRAAVAELEALNDVHWKDGPEGSVAPIAVIAVSETKADALSNLCAAIQDALAGAPYIPLYLDTGGQLLARLEAEKGRELMLPPPVFLLSSADLSIPAWRGSAPVRADIWFGLQGRAGSASPPPDPPGVPADCTGSWFRRQIARVVQAGVMPLQNGLFGPEEPVTYAEYMGWLDRAALVSGRRPPTADSIPLSRSIQRAEAIAATARFLWGDDPAAALAACPPPSGLRADAPDLWRQAFHGIPGWQDVPAALEPYLVLALAEGLLYDQPALRPMDDLTREEAAWLLDRALAAGREGTTGLVVDVVDVPFVVDAAGTSSRGASLEAEEAGKLSTVYPQDSTADRLPYPEPSFTPVFCAPWDQAQQPGSRESQWLASRVGASPLWISALEVVGEPRRGRRVQITPVDAKALRALNQGTGALDGWRVAFLYGVGARLLTPVEGPVARDTTLVVRFSQEMSKETASSDHVWLRPAGEAGAKVEAAIEWREPGRELAVRPETPLAPNRPFDLVLAKDIVSAKGEPITVRDSQLAAAGLARCWRFTTDPRLRIYVGISGVPDGTKVYLPDRRDFLVTPLSTSPLVLVKPGPLEVRFETPDGGSFSQSQQVAGDSTIRMPVAPSRPSQVRVEGLPAEVAPGQTVILTLRAEDAAGDLLPDATPLTVKARAHGGVLSPASEVSLERGEGRLHVRAGEPGRVVVTFSTSDAMVPVRPAQLVTYCRYAPSADLTWSPAERHKLPEAARGAGDVQITPRFRRWLAVGSANEVRVVDSEGNGFSHVPQAAGLPQNREFWVDDLGVLHFHAAAAGKVVDLSYQYRRPRAAAVVAGLPEDDSLAKALEAALAESLRDLGYEQVAATELAAAWNAGDLTAHLASPEDAQTAMRVFGLTDLFVLTLTAAPDGSYQGAWMIWTAESGAVTKWSSAEPDAPPMHLRRGRRADASVEASYARREVVGSLRPWLALRGMEPSHTLVVSPPQ